MSTAESPAPTPSATRCANPTCGHPEFAHTGWRDPLGQMHVECWTCNCKQFVPPAIAPAATAGTEPPEDHAAFLASQKFGNAGVRKQLRKLRPAAPTGEEAETGCECSMSSSPYPEPNADGSCPLCGKRSRRVAVETLDYPAAARSIALNLAEFCDESLAYPEMIAEAARQAATELAALREALDELIAARNRWHGKWKAAHEGAERIEADLRAALAALRARVEELETPDIMGDADGVGYFEDDYDCLVDDAPVGTIREVWANRTLGQRWIVRVPTSDEDFETRVFDSLADAQRAVAEARAALAPRQTTETDHAS